jgi:hypothetical protein
MRKAKVRIDVFILVVYKFKLKYKRNGIKLVIANEILKLKK